MTTREDDFGLDWEPLRITRGTVRPRESCGPYEFCAAGGQYVIVRNGTTSEARETARGRYSETYEIWREILRMLDKKR